MMTSVEMSFEAERLRRLSDEQFIIVSSAHPKNITQTNYAIEALYNQLNALILYRNKLGSMSNLIDAETQRRANLKESS